MHLPKKGEWKELCTAEIKARKANHAFVNRNIHRVIDSETEMNERRGNRGEDINYGCGHPYETVNDEYEQVEIIRGKSHHQSGRKEICSSSYEDIVGFREQARITSEEDPVYTIVR